MLSEVSLRSLPIGEKGIVAGLSAVGLLRGRLLDLGFVPGAEVRAVRRSPLGDPIAYLIRGAVIALRTEEAQLIKLVCSH